MGLTAENVNNYTFHRKTAKLLLSVDSWHL